MNGDVWFTWKFTLVRQLSFQWPNQGEAAIKLSDVSGWICNHEWVEVYLYGGGLMRIPLSRSNDFVIAWMEYSGYKKRENNV